MSQDPGGVIDWNRRANGERLATLTDDELHQEWDEIQTDGNLGDIDRFWIMHVYAAENARRHNERADEDGSLKWTVE